MEPDVAFSRDVTAFGDAFARRRVVRSGDDVLACDDVIGRRPIAGGRRLTSRRSVAVEPSIYLLHVCSSHPEPLSRYGYSRADPENY